MAKTNLYFVQPSFVYGRSLYLPYAAGAIQAYAFRDAAVADKYERGRIVFVREDIEKAAASFEVPFVAAFSCYIWNFEYNKALAKRLKELHPECVTVFGGHSISHELSQLDILTQADYLIYGEGEEPFCRLLKALSGSESLSDIGGIAYRDGEKNIFNEPQCDFDCSHYPSPYLEGIFDDIVKDSDYEFSAILETNRGCPYECAFCDWGRLSKKIREFPLERTRAELRWMAENKIEYCYCADSNFGLFKRDNDIIDMAIEFKNETGYPQKFRVNYAKNSNDAVFEINSRLHESGMNKGVTLSFQSMTPKVLENIGRKNISMDRFGELLARYSQAGIPTYTELIFGMPGETYESFLESVDMLLEAGQHDSLFVYNCELLTNSRMGSAQYIEQHKIKTAVTPFCQDHCEPSFEQAPEKSNIIVSTDTMSLREWTKTRFYSLCVQAFHCFGLTQCMAIYLHNEHGIKYRDFYEKLIAHFEQKSDSVCAQAMAKVRRRIEQFTRGECPWATADERFGNISWPLEESLFLDIVYSFDKAADEIQEFFFTLTEKNELTSQLAQYQTAIVKKPCGGGTLQLQYDLPEYLSLAAVGTCPPPSKRSCTVRFSGNAATDFGHYAREEVWFGRRNGRMLYDAEYVL